MTDVHTTEASGAPKKNRGSVSTKKNLGYVDISTLRKKNLMSDDYVAPSTISPSMRFGSEEKSKKRMSLKNTSSQDILHKSGQEMYQDQEMTEVEMAISEAKVMLFKEASSFLPKPSTIEPTDEEMCQQTISSNEEDLLEVIEAEGERLKRLITMDTLKRRDDWKDVSLHPSYTNFQVPYHLTCRERYTQKRKAYENQFQYEISQIMKQHSYAYEVARVVRHLAITTLWPPLHSKREVEDTTRLYFRLKRKYRDRLNVIMSTNII